VTSAVGGRRRRPLLTAFAAALGVAVLGALTTDLGPWYQSQLQPAWKPPDWLFGPVWTLIFGLAAVAGWLDWERATSRRLRQGVLLLFSLNGLLNVLWSLLFFRLRRPDWALFEVFFFWTSILLLVVYSWRLRRSAALLLLPYLLWVAFAGALNYADVQLNRPYS
jgi:tryptophan-rich sensory protein